MAEHCTKAESEALCTRCGHLVHGHEEGSGCLEEVSDGEYCDCEDAVLPAVPGPAADPSAAERAQ